MKRFLRHALALTGITAILVLAGCIVSGQFVIVIPWGGEPSIDKPLYSKHIDLTGNSTWKDHKDDIKNIVDVKFKVVIQNTGGVRDTGAVYVSDSLYMTTEDVLAHATRILHGITVAPGETRTIGFDESVTYRENLAAFLSLVETGDFYLYGIATNLPFRLKINEGSQLLITFSAG